MEGVTLPPGMLHSYTHISQTEDKLFVFHRPEVLGPFSFTVSIETSQTPLDAPVIFSPHIDVTRIRASHSFTSIHRPKMLDDYDEVIFSISGLGGDEQIDLANIVNQQLVGPNGLIVRLFRGCEEEEKEHEK